MGLLEKVSQLPRRWRRVGRSLAADGKGPKLRICRFEQLEPRRPLAADIQLGAVYYEDAGGFDVQRDTIEITWDGGPAGTQLTRLVIDTDKIGDGLTIGDTFFDTAPGGEGAFGSGGLSYVASGFTVTSVTTLSGSTDFDGATSIVFTFNGFDAGERLTFLIDVDEVGFIGSNAVAEGNEFEGSKLTATFQAPGYHDTTGSDIFIDYYDGKLAASGLDLPPDDYMPPGTTPTPVRTAAAIFPLTAQPIPSSISGRVHADRDGDCLYDAGEPLLSGVTIQLLDHTGAVIGTTLTDVNGEYKFENLQPGNYGIREIQPPGYLDGDDHIGSEGGVNLVNDVISQINLGPGVDAVRYDFCEHEPASISGRVHADTNSNCLVDPGEVMIQGVTIELLGASGAVIATTLTDVNGQYRFDNLPPGTYGVREIQPPGYLDGSDHVGSEGGVNLTNDELTEVPLGPGVDAVDYDFCEHPAGTISGYVFRDGAVMVLDNIAAELPGVLASLPSIRDGVRSGDDAPIAGVTLRLLDGAGAPVLDAAGNPMVTTSGSSGYYRFSGLRAGIYTVVEAHPSGYIDGIDTPGSTGGTAAAVGRDVISEIALGWGENSVENNFSEILVDQPPPRYIYLNDPTPPPPFSPPPVPFLPELQPLLVNVPLLPELAYRDGGTWLVGYTWHLSVVNGGRPRGPSVALASDASVEEPRWEEMTVNDGRWILLTENNGENGNEAKHIELLFGLPDAIPVTGDFDGDGNTDVGVFVDGYWYIDLNGNGVWDVGDLWSKLGGRDDLPVTGDWDGDGKTDIGIWGRAWPGDPRAVAAEPGLPTAENPNLGPEKNIPPKIIEATGGVRTMQRTSTGTIRTDLIDHVFSYGVPGDIPLAGDWNGDGVESIAVFRNGRWDLDTDGDGVWSDNDATVYLGRFGDRPVVGDFNGDGIDELGIFRAGTWYLDIDGNRVLDARDRVFQLGGADDMPVVGDFNGDGVDEVGIYQNGGKASQNP